MLVILDERGAHVVGDIRAQDSVAGEVYDRRNVGEAATRPDIGDVADAADVQLGRWADLAFLDVEYPLLVGARTALARSGVGNDPPSRPGMSRATPLRLPAMPDGVALLERGASCRCRRRPGGPGS
jgi:hypothetical protein